MNGRLVNATRRNLRPRAVAGIITAATTIVALLPGLLVLAPAQTGIAAPAVQASDDRPNILWLVSEDNGTVPRLLRRSAGAHPDARSPGQPGRAVRALFRPAGLRAFAVHAHHRHVLPSRAVRRSTCAPRARSHPGSRAFPPICARPAITPRTTPRRTTTRPST